MARELVPLLLFQSALLASVSSQQGTACDRPNLGPNIVVDLLQRYFQSGAELFLSCRQGYSPLSGPSSIVCNNRGEWTKTNLKCIPKRCPYPDEPPNGYVFYEDNLYQSTTNYTCHQGYVLHGVSSAECLHNGTWSAPPPECKSVQCDLAPIPRFGMIVYDKIISGNTTEYGLGGTYKCIPPYVVTGNARGECTADGTWTEPPECRPVTCPPPQPIRNGYMSDTSQREFAFTEAIKYGCNGDYTIDGSLEIVCQDTGEWSPQPVCMAPCTVGIQRGRILYNGRKIWIADFTPNRVYHRDIVSVYCMNEARKCGYAVPIQCINGKLKIPECYEEPGKLHYDLRSGSLPSEIKQC
ncbi:beta-2-glycoprotein 1-like [Lampris incognitus]|uniref:beta-2-glycoprotein 1-like n=1 Tax=Lampris incognitus TaxID=2546036 RepID=UPI0024B5AD26|nr:beta-2-glycoprotein 1-like [Lampris incognitus]